jgi:hypothetical protein
MSSDLLRRAAAKLRKLAEAATPGPWRVEQSENWDDTTTYSVLGVTDDHGATPVPFRTTTEDAGYHSQAEADVDLAVMMHPPVALALAGLLDAVADVWASFPPGDDGEDVQALLALARAVLREEEPS